MTKTYDSATLINNHNHKYSVYFERGTDNIYAKKSLYAETTVSEKIRDIIETAFNKSNEQILQELAKKLKHLERDKYLAFLDNVNSTRNVCRKQVLPNGETLGEYANKGNQVELLMELISKSSNGETMELTECVQTATAQRDERDILIAGLVKGKTGDGKTGLKPIINVDGWAYIISPQILTAWPGREISALTIISPVNGPWKVIKAHTLQKRLCTHCQSWKKNEKIPIKEYLSLTNNTHLLLATKGGQPIGWLDMDKLAFYDADWESYAKRSADFFRRGYAWYFHGFWKRPDNCDVDDVGYPIEAGQDNKKKILFHKGHIISLDFLNLIEGTIEGKLIRDDSITNNYYDDSMNYVLIRDFHLILSLLNYDAQVIYYRAEPRGDMDYIRDLFGIVLIGDNSVYPHFATTKLKKADVLGLK
ncbi:MAG: hypothetical protein JSV50_08355 [Desulfobacteraceae bacterium]|nr:MAG: hypothetical protein JSV50_08355 [Desulfobacteraceae bacterium]